jgi:hypothetical protein
LRHGPALTFRAQPVGDRNLDIVEEQLGKFLVTVNLIGSAAR